MTEDKLKQLGWTVDQRFRDLVFLKGHHKITYIHENNHVYYETKDTFIGIVLEENQLILDYIKEQN